jgi:hypothetical protein
MSNALHQHQNRFARELMAIAQGSVALLTGIEQVNLVSRQNKSHNLLDIAVFGGMMQALNFVPVIMIVRSHRYRSLTFC